MRSSLKIQKSSIYCHVMRTANFPAATQGQFSQFTFGGHSRVHFHASQDSFPFGKMPRNKIKLA